ncbi:MAG: AMP-binding protein, partial [Candidatus Didemnitutus sp.]|nr:AMP-binding protein [Candidatus Didemnitutus sp.]
MAAFASAAAGAGDVFLGNPAWGAAERAQLDELAAAATADADDQSGWLMIPTGGTSGRLKLARHDSRTLSAAVSGFTGHFGLQKVNAVGGLPLHHVSGLLGWLRCALTGGLYLPADWKEIEQGLRPALRELADGWVISLVPTQLHRLLRDAAVTDWLRQFRLVLLGGAPAWPDLLDRAAAAKINLAPSYGMTETAAMVTALRPDEFLAGARSAGSPLPRVRVAVDGNGLITVAAESNFLGYYPERRPVAQALATADLGRIDERGHLHVLGRRDQAIITGGEKVQPAEVEAVLKAATGVGELAVIGLADAEWGERVVCVTAAGAGFSMALAQRAADQHLLPHERPKAYVMLAIWPATEAGK